MPESKRSSASTRSKPEPREARRPGSALPKDPGRIDLKSWRQARRKLSELKLPPDGPRREHGDLEELKSSIGKHGLLVPVLIEPDGTVRGGSRRLRALSELKGEHAEVECIILPAGTDPAVAQLVENVHRKDLTPLEEAKAYRALLDKMGWTQTRLASEMCVSESHVSRTLRLLNLSAEAREKILSGELKRSQVESLLTSRPEDADATPALSVGGLSSAPTRSEVVAAKVAAGQPIHVRFQETSVRVPQAALPPGIRCRVFSDRVEIAVVIDDTEHTYLAAGKMPKRRAVRLSEAIHKKLKSADDALADALREARRKVLILEGEIDE